MGWLAKRGVDYLDKKTSVLDEASQLARKEALKERIVEVVTIGVRSTMQTFVDEAKANRGAYRLRSHSLRLFLRWIGLQSFRTA